ncbi:MAG: FAD-binding oxidoreductase [Pseudomonadota bacterium]
MVVIGGGVVGISCALALLEDDCKVTVLEPGNIGEGASWASCGCIAVGEIIPLSQPGIMSKVPGWLLNPEGPLAIRPTTALQMLPWFMRFLSNTRTQRFRAIAADLAQLTFQATDDFRNQMARYNIHEMLIERPVIKLFDSDRDKASMASSFALARELGCSIDEISGDEARELEPAIAPSFPHAAVLRDWSYVADCVRLVRELHRAFVARGGVVISAGAVGFEKSGEGVRAVRTNDGDSIEADEFVLSAGSQSKELARQLGISLPLEGLIGYWTGLPTPNVDLKHTVFSVNGGFGLMPFEAELAVAGTVEFAGAKAKPNWRRADVLVEKAKRVLPGLQTQGATRRMGRRPFMPDTRPVIGKSKHSRNVTFATGHGQLGVTLAATTGRMVKALVTERPLNADISAFGPDRFE